VHGGESAPLVETSEEKRACLHKGKLTLSESEGINQYITKLYLSYSLVIY
jgi:hypothetical protein